MKLKNFLHKQKLKYKGKRIAPLFNAFHTFLFVPNETTSSGSHIRDAADLKRVMSIVIISLMPCLLFGMWNIGHQYFIQNSLTVSFWNKFTFGAIKVLPIIATTYITGLSIEFFFAIIRRHEVNEGFLVTGILVPLIIPIDLPLWMLAVSVSFGIIIGKEIFGGTGMNILNPALTIRAFLFFAYPNWMTGDKIWVASAKDVDTISGETILGSLAANKGLLITNEGVKVGGKILTTLDMIVGTIPGSIGETSVLAIGIGGIILIASGIASWKIILSMLVGGSCIALIFNFYGANDLMSFPWYQHLLVGGFAFGTIFMATDPVSAAQTEVGKYIYGFLSGIISMLVRIFNPAFPEGVMMAILLMNIFAPLIDHYVIQKNIQNRKKRLKLKSTL